MRKKPERIDGIIKSIVERLGEEARPTSEGIGAIWKEMAGDKAARHTKPASLRKKRLIINVDGSSWLYELTLKKEFLLGELKKKLGEDTIKELQFRIGEL
jgi:predicted nucleic acid-binding Zn ribbon protein